MKSKTNQITLTYILISIFMAIISHKLLQKHIHDTNYQYYSFLTDTAFIILTGIVYKFILSKNDNRNIAFFKKLKNTNDEIKESNEKYDIVAKATSDTIWDWKIEEDNFTWNKGIETIFGYQEEQVGTSSKWWF